MPGSPLGRIDELAVLLGQFVIGTEHIVKGVGESLHRYSDFVVITKVGKLSEQSIETAQKERERPHASLSGGRLPPIIASNEYFPGPVM